MGAGLPGLWRKSYIGAGLGFEQDESYIQLARDRIEAIEPEPFEEEAFSFPSKRNRPRVPFSALLENGLLKPGQKLYFGQKSDVAATVLANGQLKQNGYVGSIHQVGKALRQGPCNGWEHWYYLDNNTGKRGGH